MSEVPHVRRATDQWNLRLGISPVWTIRLKVVGGTWGAKSTTVAPGKENVAVVRVTGTV